MSTIGTTYSFKDLTGSIISVLSGPLLIGGQLGIGQITLTNTTEHGAIDTAADGVVMPSFMAGDSGTMTFEMQQTSAAHKYFLEWLNALKTAAMNDDVSNWASTTAILRNIVDGSIHQATGIMPQKTPDKTYAAAGGKVTWNLLVCNLINV